MNSFRIIRIYIALILIFLTFQKVFSQGQNIIMQEIAFIDSCHFDETNVLVKDQRIAAFDLLLQMSFGIKSFLSYDYKERNISIRYKDYVQTRDGIIADLPYYAQQVDSIISDLFIYHKYAVIDEIPDILLLLHFLDNTLDNNVLDFCHINEDFISKIQKKPEGLYQIDYDFCKIRSLSDWLYALSEYTDVPIDFDPHGVTMSEKQYLEYILWSKEHKGDTSYDSKYLDAITLFNINYWLFNILAEDL